MKALDTNVLVRFLVNDDKKMGAAARGLLESAHERGEPFLVTIPVLLELLWVLKAIYGLSRQDILDALGALALMPVLEFESSDLVHDLIQGAYASRLELADLLIGLCAREKGCSTTLTMDRRAARSDLFEVISLAKS